jgi:hypothetical protein
MTELTPSLVSQRLDAWGPPRRLVSLPIIVSQAPATTELLRQLRHRLSSRVHWVAKATGLPEHTVRRVLRSLLATSPGKPEELEPRRGDGEWLR